MTDMSNGSVLMVDIYFSFKITKSRLLILKIFTCTEMLKLIIILYVFSSLFKVLKRFLNIPVKCFFSNCMQISLEDV